jgi:hypothetical protein
MILRQGHAFALAAVFCAASAWGQTHPSYESLWHSATQKTNCVPASYSDFTLVTCKDDLILWYFTKPNHPAHPGVIKRIFEEKKEGWVAREEGHSFAPDSAQPAFKAWLAQIADLDRRMKEDVERRKRQKSNKTSY